MFIDYLQQIPLESGGNMAHEVGKITRQIRAIAIRDSMLCQQVILAMSSNSYSVVLQQAAKSVYALLLLGYSRTSAAVTLTVSNSSLIDMMRLP
ncbi:MAG: hypothetical protein RMY28_022970 [Nostoc sp. ChiSLP01]|nr:hypothetical protein [Nostoc sp. CmiSLP01]MDZ8284005.1 hypothetical protein [Nostoc sp. ChiSLP01]